MTSEEADKGLSTALKDAILSLPPERLIKLTLEAMNAYNEQPGQLLADLGAIMTIADHIQQTHGRVHIASFSVLVKIVGKDDEPTETRARKLRTCLRTLVALKYISDIDPISRTVKLNIHHFEPFFEPVREGTDSTNALKFNDPVAMENRLTPNERKYATLLCEQMAEHYASLTE